MKDEIEKLDSQMRDLLREGLSKKQGEKQSVSKKRNMASGAKRSKRHRVSVYGLNCTSNLQQHCTSNLQQHCTSNLQQH
jgi:hypothetical protein